MEIAMGFLPMLIRKVGGLLVGEYKLQKGVKGEIMFLQPELESMQAALEEIATAPPDQLDKQDKIWASEVRELCYDIEDSIDTFVVRCTGGALSGPDGMRGFIHRSLDLLTRLRIRRQVAADIRDIKRRVVEAGERRERYRIDVARPAAVDPRLLAHYKEATELVGIDEARDEVISILMEGDDQHGKIVSIVGFGGLGKTTLANAVYEKLKENFDCWAFVSVSQTPHMRKIFKGLLYELGKNVNDETLDERQLIDQVRKFLQTKRYFVVVDDIWDISVWKRIRCALPDNDVGYTIITTTRIIDVAEQAGGVHKLKPLSLNNSRKLFFRRIFGNKNKDNNEEIEICPDDELAEVSDRILKKCAGVPLAIITMASLLACKARNKLEWYEVYNSIGTGMENNMDVENMRKILSLSYYDLPCHLRSCLLYLSMFPEDFEIDKDRLIRMWIAEGFIQCEKQGKNLFELGEIYFNELINRSMIQPTQISFTGLAKSCRIHDMVLDLICSLSCEQNFVTVLNDMDSTSSSNMIRRLSLQNGNKSHIMSQATRSLLQCARSVVIFPSDIPQVPAVDRCRVLRVLDLEDCNLSQTNSLKYLENLYHLRYLGLSGTSISQLPDEIGNLQFLQTLAIDCNNISSLPSSVVQLRNLMFLEIDEITRLPNGIGNLTCLEQLSRL
ncbi:hypothetical protein PVAP13_8KG354500 [Panicum virgatum]|uniref:Uncharacterized protein n=1 Tax=Panicum virgatum TaxID=38727 RepID=A0A8T0PNE1_PANVG|nr:hypothetical protein PVAP13_8KG354500 [Panicum virgatum]